MYLPVKKMCPLKRLLDTIQHHHVAVYCGFAHSSKVKSIGKELARSNNFPQGFEMHLASRTLLKKNAHLTQKYPKENKN